MSSAFLAVSVLTFSAFPESPDTSVTHRSDASEDISQPEKNDSVSSEISEKSDGFMKAVWVPFMSLKLSADDNDRSAAEKLLENILYSSRNTAVQL